MGSGTCYCNMAECADERIELDYLAGVDELWKALGGQEVGMVERCRTTNCSVV